MANQSFSRPKVRPWLENYPDGVPTTLEYPTQPLWWLLQTAADEFPDRIACNYYDQTLTYKELFDSARRIAAHLRQTGVQPGDRVGVLLPNVPEYYTALYGIWMAGAVTVSLSPLMVAEEIDRLLGATQCETVITLDLFVPNVVPGENRPKHIVETTLQGRLPFWQRIGYAAKRFLKIGFMGTPANVSKSDLTTVVEQETDFEPISSSPETPAYLLSTGGTTGFPKVVCLSHGNLMANAWQLLHWMGNRRGTERILAVLPFFHSYGLTTTITTGVALAATMELHHRFETQRVLQLIVEKEPTIFPAVPAMLVALNKLMRTTGMNKKTLRHCMSGGAALDPNVAREFAEHTGATVVEGYGLSETSPVTHLGPIDGTAKERSIGLPLPDTDALIVDAETGTQVVPQGEVGELIIHAPQVMLGYWKNPQATSQTIRDGWLFTGDLAVQDNDGFFQIVDRKKDLIITSGFNVYPSDVEQVLRQHPQVEDAAVVGEPDEDRGEVVKAVLHLRPNAEFDRHEFDLYCKQHLGSHKRPRIVEVVTDGLPRNFLGKVLRRKVRKEDTTTRPPTTETTTTQEEQVEA